MVDQTFDKIDGLIPVKKIKKNLPTDVNEKLIRGAFGNYIKGQKLPKNTEKKYKEPPYKDLAASVDLQGEVVSEKAVSQQQQKFMGMVYATKKGKMKDPSDEVLDAAMSMSMKDAKKYASTKHDKLPKKIEEKLDNDDKPFVKKLVGKLRSGSKTHAKQADDLEKAMKENTAIESELVIQDWNVDDIKFTEIETVDIIKPKPLKENRIEKIKSRPMPKNKLRREIKPVPMPEVRLKDSDRKPVPMPEVRLKDSDRKPVPMPEVRIKGALDRYEPIPGKPGRVRLRPDAKVKPVPLPKPPKRPGAATPVPMPQPNFRKLPERKPMPLRPGDKVERKPMPLRPGDKPTRKPMSDHYDWRNDLGEDWQKVNRKDKTDGLSKKAVKAYRRENPGSKLKTAVTKDPKKLKKGSKDAKRRLSFCRRMKGMKKRLTSAKTARDPDSRINKALRRWNC